MSATPPSPSTAFTEAHFDDAYPEGYEHHYWPRGRNRIVCRWLWRLVPRGARVLEIGCGRGAAVATLAAAGYDALGVELGSSRPLDVVRERITTSQDAFALPAAVRQSVQAVLLLDVLEHVEDRQAFLGQILEHFPAALGLVLTVPARTELWSAWDEHYGHFLRYDRPALTRELESAGLAVTGCSYLMHGLYLPLLVQAQMHRRPTTASPPRLRPLHGLLAGYLDLEERLLPRWLAGTSIIAVAERRAAAVENRRG